MDAGIRKDLHLDAASVPLAPSAQHVMRSKRLIVRVDGGPHALFGPEIANRLDELVDRVDHDPHVHSVVFTGAHPKRFISHADVRWLQEGGAATPSVPANCEPALVGQTVVVIGGTSGIGLETARRARDQGADLILAARDLDRLNRVGRELVADVDGGQQLVAG